MPPARPASLKVRALQWLAQREHSRAELRSKLLRLLQRGASRHGPAASLADDVDTAANTSPSPNPNPNPSDDTAGPAAEVDALLLWLQQHGHLCDARFTESRVHAREARFGNRRIQQELQQHGVTLGAEAKLALAQSEFERASALWRRKYRSPAADAAGRLRQMRFLAGRGFSLAVVQRVVKQGGHSNDDDALSDMAGDTAGDAALGAAGGTARNMRR